MNPLAQIADSALVRVLGLLVLIRLVYSALYAFVEFTKNRLFSVDFKQYGEWVVVTGSTDGIGKALAREFAKRGLNIVLISRTQEKLISTAKEIESDFHVKTLWVQADFKHRDCYTNIEKGIQNLDIGVLVNNVGIAAEVIKPLTKYTKEELWNTIDVNCGATTMMTRIVLPDMKTRKRGLIINVSSLTSEVGLPGFGVYAATKSFMKMFSANLQQELVNHNIKVYCFIPGMIKTKLVDLIGEPLKKGLPTYFAPEADQFARWAMRTLISRSRIITGFWGHTFAGYLVSLFPFESRMKGITYLYTSFLKMDKKKI